MLFPVGAEALMDAREADKKAFVELALDLVAHGLITPAHVKRGY